MDDVSTAVKLSWASRRETTRLEDEAYCLLSIFGANMPLLYGEGVRAFERLQHEIIKTATELSFIAHKSRVNCNLLATSIKDFKHCRGLYISPYGRELNMTNKGLKLESARFRIEREGSFCSGGHYLLFVAEEWYRSSKERLGNPDGPVSPAECQIHPHYYLGVCFQRVGDKEYIRHHTCRAPHPPCNSGLPPDDPVKDETVLEVTEDDVHILCCRHQVRPLTIDPPNVHIILPSNDTLKLQWPIAYPLRNWDSGNGRIIVPDKIRDQIFIVKSSHPSGTRHEGPMIVVRATHRRGCQKQWTLTGYFLTSSQARRELTERANKSKTLNVSDQPLDFDLTNNSFSTFESALKKHARLSVRVGFNLFLSISFTQKLSRSYRYPSWYMHIEHITLRQRLQNKFKSLWFESLLTQIWSYWKVCVYLLFVALVVMALPLWLIRFASQLLAWALQKLQNMTGLDSTCYVVSCFASCFAWTLRT